MGSDPFTRPIPIKRPVGRVLTLELILEYGRILMAEYRLSFLPYRSKSLYYLSCKPETFTIHSINKLLMISLDFSRSGLIGGASTLLELL